LGDLHAQIIDIIFVLTFVALLLAFLMRKADEIKNKTERDKFYKLPLDNIMIILLLPVMFMTNAWDYPIYLTAAGIAFLCMNLIKYDFRLDSILFTIIDCSKVLILSLLLIVPYMLNFYNPTEGVHITNIGHIFSPLYIYQMILLWGYQLFFVILFFVYILRTEKRYQILTSLNLRKKTNPYKLTKAKVKLDASTGGIKKILTSLNAADIFAVIISICAIGLVLIPELVYEKDVNGADFYRANTTWKVTLQAFILFDVVIGYIAVRVFTIKRSEGKNLALKFGIFAVIAAVLMYPIWSLEEPFNSLKDYKTLDVGPSLSNRYPDDYQAIKWLNENVKGQQPVVLEANGDSYSDYGRISSATGLPTILGWYVHQWTWRGAKTLPEINQRVTDIATVYESDDISATKSVIQKYSIKYIVVGKLEKDKFKNIKDSKIAGLGTTVLNLPNIKIIKVS
jgi:YYY domain-containing protein